MQFCVFWLPKFFSSQTIATCLSSCTLAKSRFANLLVSENITNTCILLDIAREAACVCVCKRKLGTFS